MAITVDASTPTILQGSVTGTTTTSNAFSPPANALVVVFGLYESNAGSVNSVSDSLASHLTYRKLIASATTNAYADVWVADVGGSPPGSMTVTLTWSASLTGTSTGVGVLVLNGAAAQASQTGHTATGTGVTGGPTATLAAAATDSWILAGVGYKSATAATIPVGQTDVFNGITQAYNSAGVTKTGMIQGNSAPGNSNLTINDTAPSTTWSISVAEILAGAAGAATGLPDLIAGPPHR